MRFFPIKYLITILIIHLSELDLFNPIKLTLFNCGRLYGRLTHARRPQIAGHGFCVTKSLERCESYFCVHLRYSHQLGAGQTHACVGNGKRFFYLDSTKCRLETPKSYPLGWPPDMPRSAGATPGAHRANVTTRRGHLLSELRPQMEVRRGEHRKQR